ncbi:MAG TPA: ABC transporter ATP-binding protein [Chloroflexota bacterium]|nr:ABC transporter ATP-binding protein [Chloroflexota bacterium]
MSAPILTSAAYEAPRGSTNALLSVQDLRTHFFTRTGVVKAVDGVSFEVWPGETLGIVGESGSGKSVTALSIMRLIPSPPGRIVSGHISFQGKDLLALNKNALRQLRGNQISMIFQDPMTSLNPVFTIGYQLTETIKAHQKVSDKQARLRSVALLEQVGIPSAARRLKDYPHNFSGGMRQRVVIAMALACNPKLIIADEPTTALDVTIQAQILDLLRGLSKEYQTAVLLITHDLGVVASLCDRIVVMYGGKVLETGTVDQIFKSPRQPYTQGLLQSIPRLDQRRGEPLTPIPGSPPDMLHPPRGCPFMPRCPLAVERCVNEMPPLIAVEQSTQQAACWVTNPPAR